MSSQDALLLAIRQRILQLCDQRGITINRMCTLSGVNKSTVNDIMNGQTDHPGVLTIQRLCTGLHISVYDFFNSPLFRNLEGKKV